MCPESVIIESGTNESLPAPFSLLSCFCCYFLAESCPVLTYSSSIRSTISSSGIDSVFERAVDCFLVYVPLWWK